jgi:hypothetical protein
MATEKRIKDRRRWLFLSAALGLMGVVYCLSGISELSFFRGARFPSVLTWLMNSIHLRWGTGGFFSYSISLHPDYLIHKAGHIMLYGLLGLCLYRATGRSLRLTMLIVVLFAFSDEWHQSMVRGRSSRFFDVVLDTVSAWSFIKALKKTESIAGQIDCDSCDRLTEVGNP